MHRTARCRLAPVVPAALVLLVCLAPAADDAPPEHVVLLHGLARTDRSMRPLEERLAAAGFRVHNLRYPATEKAPDALVEHVTEQIAACCADAPVLHLVGHSLGGILARAWLTAEPRPNAGRLVMLAPPNRGSELVDQLGDTALFRWILGPTATELGTGEESLPNRLPPPPIEFGVIAGTDTVNPAGSVLLPEEDDGMVAVERTKLPGMADFTTVPVSHAFIMRSEAVAAQVIHFLRHGRFQPADAPDPEE